jgi:N-acetyl-anhydromuramyl-L-alanine amidase AmpD
MPGDYNPGAKQDPLPRLRGALEPNGGTPPVTPINRPDFNEYPLWSRNHEDRRGTKVDLFLLHTEEGGPVKDGADRLARWLQGPVQVSYHYTISQDPVDNGVTVVDVVDTDRASWSALSANRRSINLVFAGSRAAWTRQQWLANGRAIDVAAYLAAQDCAKYNIPRRVIKPPYGPPGGVSDHAYVTRYLKDGTHTDVGPNFPWDVFEASFLKYANPAPTPPPPPVVTPPTPPAKPDYHAWTDRQLLEEIWKAVTK